MSSDTVHRWRTLLLLGRVSNLPTVWSNCLAGWWLGGAGHPGRLALLLPGVSLLYLGGMFLNDAFDADFDRQRRPERPIPSGKISVGEVWRFGLGALGLGLLLLLAAGWATGGLGLLLAGCILLYDAVHKFVTASPWLMGACRFWVYLVAASTGSIGVNGWAIFGGLALALYVVGLSYVARRESVRGQVSRRPFAWLAAPILLALAMNTGEYLRPALWLALILVLWIVFSVQNLLANRGGNISHAVTGLLAGITLVDWLAVAPECPRGLSLVFPLLLAATRLAQRFVPAT